MIGRMTEYVVGKSRCPNCAKLGRDRSADNFVEYSDGHNYCFSCGFLLGVRKTVRSSLAVPQTNKRYLPIPSDTSGAIDKKGLEWLKRYHVTWNDIIKHHIGWSESRQMLIFPYSEGCWQGRYFGSNTEHPKWFTIGNVRDLFHIIGEPGGTITLVEDVVSAIRIGSLPRTQAMPIFGSNIPSLVFTRLRLVTETVNIWLDYDKRDYALSVWKKANRLGLKTRVIITEKDPKCYSNSEIRGYLTRP